MQSLRQIAALVLLLVFSLSAVGTMQKQQQRVFLKQDQTADLAPSKMNTARQNCENWALAAGLETILQQQNVALDQSFWVMRLNGGELCIPEMPSMDALARVVNKEFVLEDGRHVRLELHFVPGAPVDIGALIAGLKQQRLSLFLWHGHPYYMSGVTYDERIGRDGSRVFIVKELRLADTYAKQPGITFQRDRDNVDEIAGILTVSVTQL
jgi:hypothetical protein